MLSGERKLENATTNRGYRRIERSYGKFTSTFILPPNVEFNKITATYQRSSRARDPHERGSEAEGHLGRSEEETAVRGVVLFRPTVPGSGSHLTRNPEFSLSG